MKVFTTIAVIFLSINTYLCAQSSTCITKDNYLAMKELYAEVITTNEYSELTQFHGELGEEDYYLNMLLIGSEKDSFMVIIKQEEYIEEKEIIRLYTMKLPKNIHIYVYSANYNSSLKLYQFPHEHSQNRQLETYISQPMRIMDVYNTWLKVHFEESGMKYDGWIPKEEYCPNPYTTCN